MRILSIILFFLLSGFCAIAQNTADSSTGTPAITGRFGGFAVTRYNYTSNASPSNSFNVRSARIQVAGRIIDQFEYRLQLQAEGTTTSIDGPHMLDVFVEWQKYKAFRVKVGQFKRAFTFENHMHPIDQGFYRYGMAIFKLSGLSDRTGEHSSAGRDLGVQIQGDLFERDGRSLLHYMVGLYNGQGINVSDLNGSKDIIGGFWLFPLDDLRIGAFGWKGSYGRKYEGRYAEVDRLRYAISGEYTPGDWTFRTEYVHHSGLAFKNPYGGNLDIATELGDKADAWYMMMSAPVIPDVFHIKLRYDVYRDNAAWNRAYTAYDLGMDYYFSRNLSVSSIWSFVNDRRLASGSHNYNMLDIQLGLKF